MIPWRPSLFISESLRTHAVEQQQQQQVVAGHTDDARGVADVWRCSVCTYDNAVDLQSCDICGVARHNPADFLPTSKNASGMKNTLQFPHLQFLVVMNLNLLAWWLLATLSSAHVSGSSTWAGVSWFTGLWFRGLPKASLSLCVYLHNECCDNKYLWVCGLRSNFCKLLWGFSSSEILLALILCQEVFSRVVLSK